MSRAPHRHGAALTSAQRALAASAPARALVDRLASRLAARYRGLLSKADLLGAGALGLAEAARTFQPSVGVLFEVFAWSRVHGAMLALVRDEAELARAAREGTYLAMSRARDDSDVWHDDDAKRRAHLEAFSDACVAGMMIGLSQASARAAAGPEEAVAKRERHAMLLRVVERARASLDAADRALIEQIHDHGQSIEAAGAALGMPYATARRAYLSALQRLAVRLRAAGVMGPPSSGPQVP